MKPDFQMMTKRELRTYMLSHRDDDEAFYAYVDKVHEVNTSIYAAVSEWLQARNLNKSVHKTPKNSSWFILADLSGDRTGIKVQNVTSLPTDRKFMEIIIGESSGNYNQEFSHYKIVFVTKNETVAIQLEKD